MLGSGSNAWAERALVSCWHGINAMWWSPGVSVVNFVDILLLVGTNCTRCCLSSCLYETNIALVCETSVCKELALDKWAFSLTFWWMTGMKFPTETAHGFSVVHLPVSLDICIKPGNAKASRSSRLREGKHGNLAKEIAFPPCLYMLRPYLKQKHGLCFSKAVM